LALGEGKGLGTCYNGSYIIHDHRCFTISKVADDWQEIMISKCTMLLSIAYANGQLDLQCS